MPDNPFRLDGKPAIVVGAALGIGRAIALAFADAGAKVACLDIDEEAARETAAQIKSGRRRYGDGASLRRDERGEHRGRCQGRGRGAWGPACPRQRRSHARADRTIVELEPVDWNRAIAINLSGAYLMSRAVLPAHGQCGGGSIIHIASQMGRVGAAGRGVYCATKGALIQLAKVMAVDHARDNIRVNTLSPGAVETERSLVPLWQHGGRSRPGGPEASDRPSRPGRGDRTRRPLSCERRLSFMTGSDLLIDGGYTAV